MAKVGIFYGSDGGNLKDAVETLAEILGDADTFDVADSPAEKLGDYNALILASSTWGDGDLQADWEEFIDTLDEVDFSGKTVALMGMGDQEGYEDTYCDAMRHLYDKVRERGANIVGAWSKEGYEFSESAAIVDDKFVGLALDEDNQGDLTEDRLKNWVAQIKGDLGL